MNNHHLLPHHHLHKRVVLVI